MEIEAYSGKYDGEIVSLILGIQNQEAGIGLSLKEQPDLKDIRGCYQDGGGRFWVALSDGRAVGTLGLMLREDGCAVMKKFFVDREYRSQRVGLALYKRLLSHAEKTGVRHILLDTPSVAHASHRFYKTAGFRRSPRRSCPSHIRTRTGIRSSICWTCERRRCGTEERPRARNSRARGRFAPLEGNEAPKAAGGREYMDTLNCETRRTAKCAEKRGTHSAAAGLYLAGSGSAMRRAQPWNVPAVPTGTVKGTLSRFGFGFRAAPESLSRAALCGCLGTHSMTVPKGASGSCAGRVRRGRNLSDRDMNQNDDLRRRPTGAKTAPGRHICRPGA